MDVRVLRAHGCAGAAAATRLSPGYKNARCRCPGRRPKAVTRSEERRVGKEWVSTCRSGWEQDHEKKKRQQPSRGNRHVTKTQRKPTTNTYKLPEDIPRQ